MPRPATTPWLAGGGSEPGREAGAGGGSGPRRAPTPGLSQHPATPLPPASAPARALPRQWLHAHRLSFDHPATGERMSFTSEYPLDLAYALDALREGRVQLG